MERFGQRVRRKRREMGISQERLGELSGQSRNYINRLETGNIQTPTLPIAERIATALGVDVKALYGEQIGATGWVIEEPPGSFIVDLESDELIQLYNRLPDPDRDRLIAIARALYQLTRE
jgi:transcriptional regulator with XRE-family HTH domain